MTQVGRREVLRLMGATVVAAAVGSRRSWAQEERQGGDWPQARFDAAKTGYNPNAAGPKQGIEQAWEFHMGIDIEDKWASYTEPIVAEGVVILPSTDFSVYALDVNTGEELWRRETASEIVASPAIVDGAVVMQTEEDVIRGFDLLTGDELGSYRHPLGPGAYSITYEDDRVYLPGVVAVNLADEGTEWETDIGAGLYGVAIDDQTVYAGAEAPPSVYALDVSTGSEKWWTPFTDPLEESVPPVVADGKVFVLSKAGRIHALEAATGDPLWEFEAWDTSSVASIPAVFDNTLFYGHAAADESGRISPRSGGLFAIDTTTGEQRWHVETAGGIGASPMIADGVVYVGTYGDIDSGDPPPLLYAFDTDTGDELWRREMADNVVAHSIAGDRLYTVIGDGFMEVFGPAESTTPVSQGAGQQSRGADGDPGTNEEEVSSDGQATRQRGFFSNGGNDPDFLDVYTLTLLGFMLSVLGIIFQMMGGD